MKSRIRASPAVQSLFYCRAAQGKIYRLIEFIVIGCSDCSTKYIRREIVLPQMANIPLKRPIFLSWGITYGCAQHLEIE
jgi:hypothetical protein